MAEIVTGTTTGLVDMTGVQGDIGHMRHEFARDTADSRYATALGHADIRHEAAHDTASIRRDVAGSESDIRRDVQSTAWGVADRVENNADRIHNAMYRASEVDTQHFIAGQQEAAKALAALTAANTDVAKLLTAGIGAAQTTAAQNRADLGASTMQVMQAINTDGTTTRNLINDLKMQELNRMLTERNTEIIEGRNEGKFNVIQSNLNAMQYQLASQINAINSQLSETRQGLVNFGYMSNGAGQQTSTTNSVR